MRRPRPTLAPHARRADGPGGKDGHPFPVPLEVYDKTLAVLRRAVEQAKLGHEERLQALQRLDREARRLERTASMSPAEFERRMEREKARSHEYGGRTVLGSVKPPSPPRQRPLPFDAPNRCHG